MHVVDSCGWLEWFTDGDLADAYRSFLDKPGDILVPSIIVYEVYKVLKREKAEEVALACAGKVQESTVLGLDGPEALMAADVALERRLAMADAIVYTTAIANQCELITSDGDLKDLPGVRFIPKTQ